MTPDIPDLPPGTVTGIGSLPYLDAVDAVDAVARLCPELPFWPQLPRRSPREGMLVQALAGPASWLESEPVTGGLRLRASRRVRFRAALREREAPWTDEEAPGLHAFVAAGRAARLPRAVAVKGQIAGPLTLGACTALDDGTLLDDIPLMASLTAFLIRRARWMVRELARTRLPVVAFVDEPVLGLALVKEHPLGADLAVFLRRTLEALAEEGALAGVHCCSAREPDKELPAAVWSFDAHRHVDAVVGGAAADLVAAGRRLAFGLVPTEPPPQEIDPELTLRLWESASAALGDPAAVARRTLVTPACGLGNDRPRWVAARFQIAHDLSRHVAAAAGA